MSTTVKKIKTKNNQEVAVEYAVKDSKNRNIANQIDNLNSTKQPNLPTYVSGQYLHVNENTGNLEWEELHNAVWGQISGTVTNQTDLTGYLSNNFYTKTEIDAKEYATLEDISGKANLSGGNIFNGNQQFNGLLYLEGATPFVMSKQGKIGLRATNNSNAVLGQINISNAWYDSDHYGAQMNAYNRETGKYNAFRVSHEGAVYYDEDDVAHNLVVLTGTTAPGSSTVGTIGQFYLNTTDNRIYICTAIGNNSYTWTVKDGAVYSAGDGIDISNNTISVDTDTIATKQYVSEKITNVYIYKGSVADYEHLPTNVTISGWVYNVEDTGDNYASIYENKVLSWDKLGGTFTSYSAGDGINISNNTISVDTTAIQEKLTAGDGIEIDQNTNTILVDGVAIKVFTYNYTTSYSVMNNDLFVNGANKGIPVYIKDSQKIYGPMVNGGNYIFFPRVVPLSTTEITTEVVYIVINDSQTISWGKSTQQLQRKLSAGNNIVINNDVISTSPNLQASSLNFTDANNVIKNSISTDDSRNIWLGNNGLVGYDWNVISLKPIAAVGGIKDNSSSLGSTGQVLTSTGSGIKWADKGCPYSSLQRLGNYLYEITFDSIPAYEPLNDDPVVSGCTSFVKDGKLYRNLDWNYGNVAEFKITFKDVEGMAFIDGLNDGELEGKEKLLGQLPYHICDGRNSSGLMVSTHVLFNDFDYSGSGEMNVSLTLLPYLILTTMTNVNAISSEVSNLIDNIKIPDKLAEMDMLIQVLVTDGITTKVFTPTSEGYEFINISSNPKLTNFKWLDKTVLTRNDADLQLRPNGIERWNLIDSSTTLEDLRFTLAYESSNRLSEFIGIDDTTKASSDADLTAIYNTAHSEYLIRTRNNVLWQTVHSIVYSPEKIEELYVQENFEKNYLASSNLIDDVQVNGTSVVVNKIANIPIASNSQYGVVRYTTGNGISINSGYMRTVKASDEEIVDKSQNYKIISPANLDKAIMEGLGNNSLTWSETYKSNARTKIDAQRSIDSTHKLSASLVDGLPEVIDSTSSTSTTDSLSANQGKLLNDRINNLQSIGRFLALWDCTTGLPLSNPSGYPYAYHTGDYFRVNKVASQPGEVNYMPDGSSYQGVASTVIYSGDVQIADIWFYDGTTWQLQINHSVSGGLDDVQINGTSIVSSGVANIPVASYSDYGVVKLSEAGGVGISNNILALQVASDAQIEAKTSSYRRAITASNLDKAVMEGLGNNSLTWSDAYKQSARTTIGAGAPMIIEVLGDDD